MVHCPNGHENPGDYKYCGDCGARISASDGTAVVTPSQQLLASQAEPQLESHTHAAQAPAELRGAQPASPASQAPLASVSDYRQLSGVGTNIVSKRRSADIAYSAASSREEKLDRLAERISILLIILFAIAVLVFIWAAMR